MALQLSALREALRAAKAPDDLADRAAEEVASYDSRMGTVERRIVEMRAEMDLRFAELRVETDRRFIELRPWAEQQFTDLRGNPPAPVGCRREQRDAGCHPGQAVRALKGRERKVKPARADEGGPTWA